MNERKKNIILLLIVICIAIISATIFFIMGPMANANVYHQEYVVNNEHDDARTFTAQNSPTGYGNEDGKWTNLQLSPSYSFGVRFTNVSIPRYATIKNAYIQLYSIGTTAHRHPMCRIYCDDVGNAVNFSTIGVLNICGRIYTTNYSKWNETLPYGVWVSSPSLVAPLQEIINEQNWTQGNALAFLFISDGTLDCAATFQNYENEKPAKLYVEWKEQTLQ
jgi:hypothetical protein